MLKRIITSLLLVVVLGLLILGTLWFISRHQAEKAGQKPLTFKEFFTVGYKNGINAPGVTGELSSEFTPGNTPSKPGTVEGTPVGTENGSVEVSQFTNGTLTPSSGDFGNTQSFGSNNSFGGGTIGGGSNFGGGGTIGNTPTTVTPTGTPDSGQNASSPTTSALSCTDADTNITFTQAELDRLAALQKRFDAVAQVLHSDQDVQGELSNYESLILKEKTTIELTNYCQAKVPLLADPVLKRKVPTPFWHTNNDADGYFYAATPGTIDVNSSVAGKAVLERTFRINFW